MNCISKSKENAQLTDLFQQKKEILFMNRLNNIVKDWKYIYLLLVRCQGIERVLVFLRVQRTMSLFGGECGCSVDTC